MDRPRRARRRRPPQHRHARIGSMGVRARNDRAKGSVRVPGAARARAVGSRLAPVGRHARRLRRRRALTRRARSPCLAVVAPDRRELRGRRSSRPAGSRAPARPTRVDAAVVLRERLDVPDRARRRPDPRRREPVRPQLRRLWAGTLLRPGRNGSPRHGRASGCAPSLRVLPGSGLARGCVGRPTATVGRLSRPRGADDARVARRRTRLPRPSLGPPRLRCRGGRESGRCSRSMVRYRRCADAAPPARRVRPRAAASGRMGGPGARCGDSHETVRARGGAVPARDVAGPWSSPRRATSPRHRRRRHRRRLPALSDC
jgi:hypothetical protein